MKTCPSCGSEYPATTEFFYKRSNGTLYRKCKKCHIAKVMETSGEWQKNNRDKVAEYGRRYHRKHPEVNPAKSRLYRKRHPEAIKARNTNAHARRRGANCNHTRERLDFIYDYQRGRCFYCMSQLDDHFHWDHFIPLAKGGTNDWTNMVASCPRCNRAKSDQMPEDYLVTTTVSGGRADGPAPCHT